MNTAIERPQNNILDLPVSLPNGKEELLHTLFSEFEKVLGEVEDTLWDEIFEKNLTSTRKECMRLFSYMDYTPAKEEFFEKYPEIQKMLDKLDFEKTTNTVKYAVNKQFIDDNISISYALHHPLHSREGSKIKNLGHDIPIDISKEDLKKYVENMKNIKTFKSHRYVKYIEKDILKIVVKIMKNARIIDLRESGISSLGKEKLKILVEGTKYAKVIKLGKNYIGNMGIEQIKILIQGLEKVKAIYLGENEIGNMGIDEFKILIEGLKNAKIVRMGMNNLAGRQIEIMQKELIDRGVKVYGINK